MFQYFSSSTWCSSSWSSSKGVLREVLRHEVTIGGNLLSFTYPKTPFNNLFKYFLPIIGLLAIDLPAKGSSGRSSGTRWPKVAIHGHKLTQKSHFIIYLNIVFQKLVFQQFIFQLRGPPGGPPAESDHRWQFMAINLPKKAILSFI